MVRNWLWSQVQYTYKVQAWLPVQMKRWGRQLHWRNANFPKITDWYPPESYIDTEEKQTLQQWIDGER